VTQGGVNVDSRSGQRVIKVGSRTLAISRRDCAPRVIWNVQKTLRSKVVMIDPKNYFVPLQSTAAAKEPLAIIVERLPDGCLLYRLPRRPQQLPEERGSASQKC